MIAEPDNQTGANPPKLQERQKRTHGHGGVREVGRGVDSVGGPGDAPEDQTRYRALAA